MPGYDNLIFIKGIGPLSVAVLLTHIGTIDDFKNNETSTSGYITKRGNKLARTALVKCALIAIRYSPYLRRFYETIKHRRRTGKAVIATVRKLLNTIFHTPKHKWVFEEFPNFKLLPCNQNIGG